MPQGLCLYIVPGGGPGRKLLAGFLGYLCCCCCCCCGADVVKLLALKLLALKLLAVLLFWGFGGVFIACKQLGGGGWKLSIMALIS